MNLQFESHKIEDYLKEIPPLIEFSDPIIQRQIEKIKSLANTKRERARIAFEIARDRIKHSFDTQNDPVTINAADVLDQEEGICFAKAHLLATLLRGMDIPTGFCYQRVLKKTNDIELGHALHGLNAVYLDETGWFRLDPRGNKPGVDSQFSTDVEKLAYPIRPELGEIDYPNVFVAPLPKVILTMKESKDTHELFFKRPEYI